MKDKSTLKEYVEDVVKHWDERLSPGDLDESIMYLINHKAFLESIEHLRKSELPCELKRFKSGIEKMIQVIGAECKS